MEYLGRADWSRFRELVRLAVAGAGSTYDDSRTWKYRLNESEILQTFAEVGVAIAGFTGVVFVLGNRATGEWSHAERCENVYSNDQYECPTRSCTSQCGHICSRCC